ncbi:sensor histidine kinase [Kineococcus rhizosphaerae]|uniref:histidine kinase n=1 Tax=Kineococcus rhizosphaerae TaxID=559628 RepID=A0A2T0R847_9ACTN|nr:HAMP domain-containing sensor histidine kinase [Kineococcus rhizosphaerae]PRY17331.1 phospho-acceptor domain-containing protein [Kineococcus rhizosphaerae]
MALRTPARTTRPVLRRLLTPLLLLGVPLLLAVAARWAWSSGRLPGGHDRVLVHAAAEPGDWALVAGAVLSVVLVLRWWLRRRARAAVRRAGQEAAARAGAQSARDRQLLLGRLDHELKNPLTAIRLALANVAAEESSPEQRERGLRSIEEQVLRLSRLTADLRKIADVRTAPLARHRVDLTALLEEAVEVVGEQPRAEGRRISLDLPRAPWPLPPVPGDGDLLSLALVNLVDNAVKYTPAGEHVEVRGRETPEGVLVEVADTGQGIPAEDLPHVWEELFRSQSARSVAGSGLGLPLVRAVVERHGGTVSAQSRENRGTVVRVVLPVTDPPDDVSADASADPGADPVGGAPGDVAAGVVERG